MAETRPLGQVSFVFRLVGWMVRVLGVMSLAIGAEQGEKGQAESNAGPGHKDKPFTEAFRRTSGWTAGDGAFSVPLSDGRVMWLFGDSHVDDLDKASGTVPCLFQVRNAALLSRGEDILHAQTLSGHGPGFRSLFKDSDDDNFWFWPLCGIEDGASIYVYLTGLRKTAAEGKWAFAATGKDYWAKMPYPAMTGTTYVPLPDFQGITFGWGLARDEDGYLYAFGMKQNGIGSDVFVARLKSPEQNDWSFWDGQAWSGSASKAAVIAKGASTSIHVCKVKGRFVLTTSAFSVACDQGKEILMSTSHRPTGPFTALRKVFTVDDIFQGHHPFFYCPVAHPEFINGQNELLVTYSINGYEPCVGACVEGRLIPDHYRPKAFRVPIKAIGLAEGAR
ncbi:conserved hypothetical protein [Verrucomicrobia bacterium]|nr:conserved hypothetical protein [Verrucomicrobiota bacterium]